MYLKLFKGKLSTEKGSNVIETNLHSGQVIFDLICPWNKSTIMDLLKNMIILNSTHLI
jgi:hypothetical protein